MDHEKTSDGSSHDAEKAYGSRARTEEVNHVNAVVAGTSADGQVHRALKQRHISMIAIGGTIGTGLFLGSGAALAHGGPAGLLLGYSIMGSVVYGMMVALGEMVTLYPVSGAFTHYAARFVDESLGFAVGINYWYSYAITLPTEITAAAIVIQYWDSDTNVAVYITVFLVGCLAFNFLGVRWYGEAEFWFAIIKVIAIVGLIILGIILDLGGGPSHDRIGFRYWKNPGAFNQLNGIGGAKGRFLAFWATFIQAAFSYLGTEIVALAAGEASNPRKVMPKAIRRVFYRIALFYVGGVIVIGWLVPYNDSRLLSGASNATASPFVIAVNNAGIKVLPSIINAVILTSAYSAGQSDLFASSRTLYGLACDGKVPSIFRKCTRNGLPIYCLFATSAFGPLAYMNLSSSGSDVFNWFSNLSSVTGLLTWWSILLTYIRFYKGLKFHGIDRNSFPYRAPLQPYLSYWSIAMISLVTFFNGFQVFLKGNWDLTDFIAAYVTVPIFVALYLFWKFWKRTKLVKIEEMDFDTGRRELDELDLQEQEKAFVPTTKLEKIWDWLM